MFLCEWLTEMESNLGYNRFFIYQMRRLERDACEWTLNSYNTTELLSSGQHGSGDAINFSLGSSVVTICRKQNRLKNSVLYIARIGQPGLCGSEFGGGGEGERGRAIPSECKNASVP